MDLKQLRYFVTVAEQLHFSNAAALLDIAPSALSMQIQALERELGVRLINRTKRSVALSAAGKMFLDEARKTLLAADHARHVAIMAGRGQVGALELGYVISAAGAGIVQRMLLIHAKKTPQVRIRLHSMESPMQLELLLQRKLDAGIVRTTAGYQDEVQTIRLLKERMFVALPVGHHFAESESIPIGDLIGESFIAPQFEKDIGFARHLFEIGRAAGFVPSIEFQTKDFLTALVHVASGHGVALVPESISCIKLPGLLFRELREVQHYPALFLVLRRHDTSPLVESLRSVALELGGVCQ